MVDSLQLGIVSGDGSTTVYSQKFGAHYHSIHGALNEGSHVFVDQCLAQKAKSQSSITVFEMGFGTGLNALLSLKFAQENNLQINYLAVEAYPMTIEEALNSNYSELLNLDQNLVEQMHQSLGEKQVEITPNFKLTIFHDRLENIGLEENTIDCIFYDAFAPSVQPELWTVEQFEKLYHWININGILTTYCAKGQVKRDLKSVGFQLETIPGPPGKREMIRAFKNIW